MLSRELTRVCLPAELTHTLLQDLCHPPGEAAHCKPPLITAPICILAFHFFFPHNFGNPLKRAGRGKKLPAVKNPHFLPKAPDKAGSPQGQDRGTPSPVLPIFNEALTNDSSMRAGAFPTLTHPGRAQLNTQLSRMRPETQPKLLEAKEVPGAEEPSAGSSPKLLTSGPPSGSSALSGIYSLLPCKLFST